MKIPNANIVLGIKVAKIRAMAAATTHKDLKNMKRWATAYPTLIPEISKVLEIIERNL